MTRAVSADTVALFEALDALRAARDPSARELDRHWRLVAQRVRRACRPAHYLAEDAEQDAMLTIVHALPTLRARSPLEAARWLALVCRSERIDTHRRELRASRAHLRVANVSVDWLPGDAPLHATPTAVDRILGTLDEHIEAVLLASRGTERGRRIGRIQARTAARRLLLGEELPALRLVAGDAVSSDVVYKWVERGRDVLRPAIERWLATATTDLDRDLAEAALELVAHRRADAGRERPARRRAA